MLIKQVTLGMKVKSLYAAPWKGIVVAKRCEGWVTREGEFIEPVYDKGWKHSQNKEIPIYFLPEDCVLIKVTHNRNDKPIKKHLWKVLHVYWLTSDNS